MPGGFPLGLEICNGSSSLSGPSSKGTSVTAAAKAYGSWVQLIASTASDTCWMIVRIWPTGNSSNRCFTQIGVGAAASEVVIVNDLMATSGTAGVNFSEYSFPCNIPAGTRISARCNNTAADANNVQLILFDGSFTQMEGTAGVDSLGFITGNPSGTDVDPGASVNTKGSFVQFSASTARDYMGLMVMMGQNTTDNSATLAAAALPVLLDVAVGAGGSEFVIVPDAGWSVPSATSMASALFYPIPIPAGTRVSARAASGNNTASTRVIGATLYGIYQ